MRQRAVAAACLAVLPLAAGAATPAASPVFVAHAQGVQIYTCTAGAPGAAWQFTAPEATLADDRGQPLGKHFAGPTWQAADGSRVGAQVLAAAPAPGAGNIAWLILRATAHEGSGLMARVAFVTRTETAGGVAPAAGCDGGHVGAQARVPYSALYSFFPQ